MQGPSKRFSIDALLFNSYTLLFGALLSLLWILKYSSYGFEFTDEGYYLAWLKNPHLYDWSVSQFGYIYQPLYALVKGGVAGLRQCNILLLYSLSFLLVYLFLQVNFPEVKTRALRAAISAAISVSIFSLFNFRVSMTPSYNSLNLQALLLFMIGLIWTMKEASKLKSLAWVLIGFAGVLCFMAKPSSALLLALVLLVYVILSKKSDWKGLGLSIFSAMAFFTMIAFWIDGGLFNFIQRLKVGLDFAKIMGGGYGMLDILRIDKFKLNKTESVITFGLILITFISLTRKHWARFFIFLYSIIIFAYVSDLMTLVLPHSMFHRLIIFGVFIGFILTGFYLTKNKIRVWPRQLLILTVILLLMPHIYAFGTNGNYWDAGAAAMIFWILGVLTLVKEMFKEQSASEYLTFFSFSTLCVVLLTLQPSIAEPYRMPPNVRGYQETYAVGHSQLKMTKEWMRYLYDAQTALNEADFKSGDPILDLTGQSPGLIYAVNAENIAQAWVIGGYSGSEKQTRAALARVPCEKLAKSWILAEENGPRKLNFDILSVYGANFTSDFQRVGQWIRPIGVGGDQEQHLQALYRPIQQEQIKKSCEDLRK